MHDHDPALPAHHPELLTLVDAIARHGSFAKAAREQGKVPSAVTYAIRKLEDGLDVLLFDRSGQRARLTPAGEALLREGRHVLQSLDDLACRVKRIATGWEVELRIAVSAVLPWRPLYDLIEEFQALRHRAAFFHRGAERQLGRADLRPRRSGRRRRRGRRADRPVSLAGHGPGAVRVLRGGQPSAGGAGPPAGPGRSQPL